MDTEALRAVRRDLLKAKKKLARAQAVQRRADKNVAFWERRISDLQHQRQKAVQPSLWPDTEGSNVHVIDTDVAAMPGRQTLFGSEQRSVA